MALEFVPIDNPARLTNRPLFDPCAVIATLGFDAESVGSVPYRILQGIFNTIGGSDLPRGGCRNCTDISIT
jgi:hypothetical protein